MKSEKSGVGYGMKLDNGTAKKLKLEIGFKANKAKKLADKALVLMNLTPTPGRSPPLNGFAFPAPARRKPVTLPGLKIPVKVDP